MIPTGTKRIDVRIGLRRWVQARSVAPDFGERRPSRAPEARTGTLIRSAPTPSRESWAAPAEHGATLLGSSPPWGRRAAVHGAASKGAIDAGTLERNEGR
jgi:hypothetical protein